MHNFCVAAHLLDSGAARAHASSARSTPRSRSHAGQQDRAIMTTATLADFMALNDQLGALHRAGVPLDLGLGISDQEVSVALTRINASVARRVSQGQSLGEALEHDDPVVPLAYRCLMRIGLQSGDWSATLQGYRGQSQSDDNSRFAVLSGLLYPAIVVTLAYAGLVTFCLHLVPTLERFYRELRLRPGSVLDLLSALRETLFIWIAIPPVILLAAAVWRGIQSAKHQPARSARWAWCYVPGMAQVLHLRRCAAFADALASLLESGLPTTAAMRLAAGASGDRHVRQAVEELVVQGEQGRTADRQLAAVRALPPFLQWALRKSSDATVSPNALRMAAGMYRVTAERRADRLRIMMPLAACALLGGGATLLYGLALFLPIVDMLRQLAS